MGKVVDIELSELQRALGVDAETAVNVWGATCADETRDVVTLDRAGDWMTPEPRPDEMAKLP